MVKAGTQVRLKENPLFDMTVRAIIEDKVICDFLADGKLEEWIGVIGDIEEIPQEEMFPTKISPTLAGTEIKKWLDFKRVKPIKRQAYQDHIGVLIQAITYGEIEIKPDFKIVHHLNVPILTTEGKVAYDKMEYAARISAQDLNEALGMSGNNSEIANTIAYGSALSNLPVAIVRKLDSSDLAIIAAVAVFFS